MSLSELAVNFNTNSRISLLCMPTGSLYCDVSLKESGFHGEEIKSGSVLVVKTHKAEITWTNITQPRYSNKVCIYLSCSGGSMQDF